MSDKTEKKTKTEPQKPAPQSEIAVVCYELSPFDPTTGKPPKATPMRPSPLERFSGHLGSVETKVAIREALEAQGHKVHSINWGKRNEDDNPGILIYIWGKNAAPKPPAKPVIPPPRPRRTATSRRHAPKPETRRKP